MRGLAGSVTLIIIAFNQDGDYQTQPYGLKIAAEQLYLMGSNPALQTRAMPTLEKADSVLNAYVASFPTNHDANDHG